MINSAGGGVRMQVTRYVEVDFEGLARFNRFPNGGNTPGSGVSPLNGGAFYWRVLTRFLSNTTDVGAMSVDGGMDDGEAVGTPTK